MRALAYGLILRILSALVFLLLTLSMYAAYVILA
jgi:hypothetical protein